MIYESKYVAWKIIYYHWSFSLQSVGWGGGGGQWAKKLFWWTWEHNLACWKRIAETLSAKFE